MRPLRVRHLLILTIVTTALSGGIAAAGQASPDAARLTHEIMSPFCPGRTLATCTSPAAAELRTEIETRSAAGESADVIVESLVARFGETIRGLPKAEGIGLFVWAAPLGIGMLLLLAVLRSAFTRVAPPADNMSVDDATFRRLDDELAAID